MRFVFNTLLLLAVFTAFVSPAVADNWPAWRGPSNNGVSNEKGLPTKWSKTENVAWRLALPGPAGATPVVWKNQIFLTSIGGKGELLLLCVGTDGKEQWRKQVGAGNRNVRGDEGNSASPSPITDGEMVWALFANGDMACYTTAGEEVWKLSLPKRYGAFKIAFGMTATPVLDGDRIYLQLIHGEGNPDTREATVAAIDKSTGDEIWTVKRPSDARKECEHSYASPVIYRDDDREFLLTHGADYVVAHKLSNGEEIWRCGDLNPKGNYNPTLRFVASPTVAEGLVIVPSAKNGPVFALDPASQGNVSFKKSSYFWRKDSGTPDVPTPLIHNGLVYFCRENGNLTVVDAKTGEEYYTERTERDRHRASPVYADGKIYLCARNGTVSVVKAGKTFELLAQNKMEESLSASLAISSGRIYVRTFDALYAIE